MSNKLKVFWYRLKVCWDILVFAETFAYFSVRKNPFEYDEKTETLQAKPSAVKSSYYVPQKYLIHTKVGAINFYNIFWNSIESTAKSLQKSN